MNTCPQCQGFPNFNANMSWQINHIESNYIQDSYHNITWQYAGLHEVYTILAACNGDTTNARHQARHCADLFSGVRADATQKLPGRAAAMPAGNHIRRQENTQSQTPGAYEYTQRRFLAVPRYRRAQATAHAKLPARRENRMTATDNYSNVTANPLR